MTKENPLIFRFVGIVEHHKKGGCEIEPGKGHQTNFGLMHNSLRCVMQGFGSGSFGYGST